MKERCLKNTDERSLDGIVNSMVNSSSIEACDLSIADFFNFVKSKLWNSGGRS